MSWIQATASFSVPRPGCTTWAIHPTSSSPDSTPWTVHGSLTVRGGRHGSAPWSPTTPAPRFVARPLCLHLQLRAYRDERSPVTDALAYADQTVGARGERLPIEERLADMLRRHGPGSPQAAVHGIRAPYLRAAAERVEQRLRLSRRAD
jgi:hypothetical protein